MEEELLLLNLNCAICDGNTYTHMHTHINAISLFLIITVFFMATLCLDDFKATNKTQLIAVLDFS